MIKHLIIAITAITLLSGCPHLLPGGHNGPDQHKRGLTNTR